MRKALLVGRFQPPHLGHLEVIKEILKDNDEIVIVIAAAQMSYSLKNPFTTGERLTMLRMMLIEEKIDLYKIWLIPVLDVVDNDIWVSHLLRMIPKIDVIYGNNPFTKLLFERANLTVKSTKLYNRENYEASQIRIIIAENKDLEKYLNKPVIDFLESINASHRMKMLDSSDSTGGSPNSLMM